MPESDLLQLTSSDTLRQLQICNACRYCEGYCDMFGALGRQPLLSEQGIAHLSNLCHDCRACHQACMYTDPHPLAVNIPKAMSTARVESYEHYAPPQVLSRLLRRGIPGVFVLMLLLALVLAIFVASWGSFDDLKQQVQGPGAFYAVVPAWLMIAAGTAAAVAALALIGLGQIQYWRATYSGAHPWQAPGAWIRAVRSAAVLSAMRGGGDGCYFPETEIPSAWRRRFHMLTMYGFLLTFAATCAAAFYEHALHKLPPYPFWSVPVQLGTVGGVMVMIGVSGLAFLKSKSDTALADDRSRRMDHAFLATLFVLSATGLLLLVLRDTAAMPMLLVIHLGIVGAFFLTLPYGKMVHAAFRFSALLKDSLDRASEEGMAAAEPAPAARPAGDSSSTAGKAPEPAPVSVSSTGLSPDAES